MREATSTYTTDESEQPEKKKKLKIKLRDDKEREIQHMISTSFWGTDGRPVSAEEFLQNLFGKFPALLALKYHTISDAAALLGGVESIRATFINFQKHLYEQRLTP